MRAVLAAALAAGALWFAWWPVAAWQEARATERWLEERRAAGWQAEAGAIAVTGFPLGYARRLDAPALADPAADWAWQADTLTLSRPRHDRLRDAPLTVAWAGRQTLRRPTARADVTAERLEAELWRDAAGVLQRATLAGRALEIAVDEGDGALRWRIDGIDLTATAAQDPARLAVTARLRDTMVADADGDALPGPERADIDATVTFDAPWDRTALTDARPQPRAIVVRMAALDWGGLTLRVAGDLTIDAEGVPEGRLVVQATNWRARLTALRDAGRIGAATADAIGTVADLASRLSGRGDRLEVPLVLSDGRVRLGVVPLGPAPRIALP